MYAFLFFYVPFFNYYSFILFYIILYYIILYYIILLYFIYDNVIAVKCMYLSIKIRYQKKIITHTRTREIEGYSCEILCFDMTSKELKT